VGGANIEKNFKAASHDARIIQLAFAQGSKVEINLMPVMLKRLTYTGSTLRTRPPAFKARIARELEAQVWPHIDAGRIRVVTNCTLALSDASKAHATMEAAGHIGKILLIP
jgi:NADPH:quinone reductase-like Zn-dependent oxidoreductase